jgi:hypothetical protein
LQKSPLLSWDDHFVVVVLLLNYPEARQDCVAIVASLVINVLAECLIHPGQSREFGDQIPARSPLDTAVYFLKRCNVDLLAGDEFGDPI